MKNILLSLGLLVGLVVVAGAVSPRSLPQDKRGDPIAAYAGGDAVYHQGTSAAMVCTGKCLLLGVIRETGAPSQTILLRNTITADNVYVPNLLPLIHFQPDTGAHDNPIAFPVLFSAGIAADQSVSGGGATVIYVDLD